MEKMPTALPHSDLTDVKNKSADMEQATPTTKQKDLKKTVCRKDGQPRTDINLIFKLPVYVGLHALCVFRLFSLRVEMVGQVMGVTLLGLCQTQLHDPCVVTHSCQAVTHHSQLQRCAHRLQQLPISISQNILRNLCFIAATRNLHLRDESGKTILCNATLR